MPKYTIQPKRPVLYEGRELAPEDVLGTIETDEPIRDLVALVQFGTFECVEVDGETDDSATLDDFADFSDEVRASLAEAGITNIAQAAEYLAQHESFEPLKDIGKATSGRLIKLVKAD